MFSSRPEFTPDPFWVGLVPDACGVELHVLVEYLW